MKLANLMTSQGCPVVVQLTTWVKLLSPTLAAHLPGIYSSPTVHCRALTRSQAGHYIQMPEFGQALAVLPPCTASVLPKYDQASAGAIKDHKRKKTSRCVAGPLTHKPK